MKERFTQEQRLQFLKQFGMSPEMTANEYRGIKYDLVAFDSKAGYGRLETEDSGYFMDYQVLSPDIIAIREGEQRKREHQNQIIKGVVTYIQNDILILYEPDYSSSRIDEETGGMVGDAVSLSVSKRYEHELDIPLVGAYYDQGRLVSVGITDRKEEEELKEELLELRQQGIKPLHIETTSPEFVFSEDNPQTVSATVGNPEGPYDYDEFEIALNEYYILDTDNPDLYRIIHDGNSYTFRRLSLQDNSFWEVAIPENLSFSDVHSIAVSDKWTKLKEIHPVNFTQGKDPEIYFR